MDKTRQDVRALCQRRAEEARVPLLEVRFGRTVYDPFFVDREKRVFHWAGTGFELCGEVCSECGEPSSELENDGTCQWCSVSETAIRNGPGLSQLAMSLQLGIDQGLPFDFAGLRPVGRLIKEYDAQQKKAQAAGETLEGESSEI